jgi:c(7)-type cytochrome triheme protein
MRRRVAPPLAAAALALTALVASARADGPRTTAVGFDHYLHDRQLVVSGAESLACSRCHTLAKGAVVGKPDHATCFGGCHGAAPARPRVGSKLALDPGRAQVCTACHAEAALVAPFAGKLAVPYPPYAIDRDFNLMIGHKRHAASACTDCHAAPETRVKAPAPHSRCVGCHDGARTFAMDRCTDCHPPASGTPQPPELAVVQDSVSSAFSHLRHAARSSRGRECTTCHAAIRNTDDSELPRPRVNDCAAAGCHDGKAAFATTVACTRCHTSPPARFTVARPVQRFSHVGAHAQLVEQTACTSCHPIAIAGREVVVAGHAACAGCHADDFGARRPRTCGACHNGTEPWRPLVVDRPPAEVTELGATIDHARHPGACTGCHSLRTETAQLRPPRGHGACATSGCHAATGGPAPRLGDCTGCHHIGLDAARERARAAAPWSVRRVFDHTPHRRDRDGKELACTACHVDMSAHDVLGLAAPPKATCAPCHDGNVAFKLTGTTCTRCHAPARAGGGT